MRYVIRVVVLYCIALSVLVPFVPAGAAGIAGEWSRPLVGRVVRGFDPPDAPFGAGHLGVDFAAVPGTAVRAAGSGVVVFAGRVGASLHVVVRHPGDARTSYSFLASISVVTGQSLDRGAVVGTSGGTGPGHGADVAHFGVRVGATYVDPMLLFAPVDLAAVVHLAEPQLGPARSGPAGPLPTTGERSALVAALRVDARPPPLPPSWWPKQRVAPSRHAAVIEAPAARPNPPMPAPTKGRARPPVPVLGVAAVSLGGLALARRRRFRPGAPARSPTTLLPGPADPGLGDSCSAPAGRRPDHT